MAKFLLYCHSCDHEEYTNSKKHRCPDCGSNHIEVEDIRPRAKKENRRGWDRDLRQGF